MQGSSRLKRRQQGFSALEVLIALIIVVAVTATVPSIYSRWFEHQATSAAAGHMRVVAAAASEYIKDNYNLVSANAGPASPAVVTTSMLRATGYLQSSFGDLNPYGQSYRVLVLKPLANKLQTLIITEGGEVISELSLRAIAKQIGADGGYVSLNDPTVAEGSFAGWATSLAPYRVSPGAGHLATALFFQDGTLVNDYLYRHAVPGKPELQTMHAPINMSQNNISDAGNVSSITLNTTGRAEIGEYLTIKGIGVPNTSCSPDRLIALSDVGEVITCQAGVWKQAGANLSITEEFVTSRSTLRMIPSSEGFCFPTTVSTGSLNNTDNYVGKIYIGADGFWYISTADSASSRRQSMSARCIKY